MADVFSKRKRSRVMSRIRSRGNKDTEPALAKLLRTHGVTGWRRHVEVRGKPRSGFSVESRQSQNSGRRLRRSAEKPLHSREFRVKPDFVFAKHRLAIFVDGYFWHGCPRRAAKPKNNRTFRQRKLAANKERDQRVNRTLRRAGGRVLRIWECELAKRPESCVRRTEKTLKF